MLVGGAISFYPTGHRFYLPLQLYYRKYGRALWDRQPLYNPRARGLSACPWQLMASPPPYQPHIHPKARVPARSSVQVQSPDACPDRHTDARTHFNRRVSSSDRLHAYACTAHTH